MTKQVKKETIIKITLPTGSLTIGEGTVPISTPSVGTSQDMVRSWRKVSEAGIYDSSNNISERQ